MKALKTTLALFSLSLFLFSFTPQNTTENTNVADQIQLEDVYQSEELSGEQRNRTGNE